jgi:hypothetical protein
MDKPETFTKNAVDAASPLLSKTASDALSAHFVSSMNPSSKEIVTYLLAERYFGVNVAKATVPNAKPPHPA